MRTLAVVVACGLACSCASSPGQVVQKIKYDFGLGEKPEGYVSPSDQVMDRLDAVAKTEIKRMNIEGRHGTVKFQDAGDLHGYYYKEVKVYEGYNPLDVQGARSGADERGYVGYVSYDYRMFQSERKVTRAEAAAAPAEIATDLNGREVYRYRFGTGGTWDGGKGELTKR